MSTSSTWPISCGFCTQGFVNTSHFFHACYMPCPAHSYNHNILTGNILSYKIKRVCGADLINDAYNKQPWQETLIQICLPTYCKGRRSKKNKKIIFHTQATEFTTHLYVCEDNIVPMLNQEHTMKAWVGVYSSKEIISLSTRQR